MDEETYNGFTYMEADPSVGIFGHGWIHETCTIPEDEWDVCQVETSLIRNNTNITVIEHTTVTCACGDEYHYTDTYPLSFFEE